MPGPVLHAGATVLCAHGGQATPLIVNPRVQVAGNAVVTTLTQYSIAGCGFVAPAGNGPCATGQWATGAVRVLASGAPLAIATGVSLCMPTGTPLTVVTSQARVVAG